jgi:double-stranded uracil-DNA glycosylase
MPLTSFEPVIDTNATVLILGSMPGSRSLRIGQYYGHPQNLFWPFMEEILGVPRALPYGERLLALQAAGIALWDVLAECEREGSLDAAIIPASEQPNDFAWLLTTYPNIARVCFNGAKAANAFARHVTPTLAPAIHNRLTLIPLPSTSPANRAMPTADKLTRWRAALHSK